MGIQGVERHTAIDPVARRDGFSRLYDAHVTEVYRYVHRRCHDRGLAEDVTHDAFLAAVRTMDDPADVNIGWLLRVARNRLVDVLRRQHRYSAKLRLIGARLPEGDEDALVVERIRLRAVLARLSVEHRLVLTLHYLDEMTVASLAEEMNRTQKSVEGLIARAKENLRREWRNEDV